MWLKQHVAERSLLVTAVMAVVSSIVPSYSTEYKYTTVSHAVIQMTLKGALTSEPRRKTIFVAHFK